jgi:hypothetical protein
MPEIAALSAASRRGRASGCSSPLVTPRRALSERSPNVATLSPPKDEATPQWLKDAGIKLQQKSKAFHASQPIQASPVLSPVAPDSGDAARLALSFISGQRGSIEAEAQHARERKRTAQAEARAQRVARAAEAAEGPARQSHLVASSAIAARRAADSQAAEGKAAAARSKAESAAAVAKARGEAKAARAEAAVLMAQEAATAEGLVVLRGEIGRLSAEMQAAQASAAADRSAAQEASAAPFS